MSEAERHRREFQKVAAVARSLTETLDVEDVARRISDAAVDLLQVRGVGIGLVGPDGGLRFIALGGVYRGHPLPSRPRGFGLSARVVSEKRSYQSRDLLNDPDVMVTEYARRVYAELDTRSALVVPMRRGGEVTGVVAVSDRAGRVFSDEEELLLQTLADHAAVSLENARLYRAAERGRHEAEVFTRLARSLNESLDLETVLARVTEGARELCASDLGGVALCDPGSKAAIFRSTPGARRDWSGIRIEPGAGAGGQVLLSGQPFRTDSYSTDPRIGPEYAAMCQAEGIVAQAVVPIRRDSQIEGLLYVNNRSARAFSDHDIEVLLRLADHAAIAIKNARLFRERVEAVTAAQENEQLYRLLADNATDVIWVLGRDRRYSYVSPSVTSLTGFSVAQMIGQPLTDGLTPASRDLAVRVLDEELAQAEADPLGTIHERTLELEHRRKDGSTVWAETRASVVRDASGRVTGILAVTRDITLRRQTESQVRLQVAALEAATNGIVITDANGAIEWVNPALTQMTGYSLKDVIGNTPRVFKSDRHDAAFFQEMWTTILRGDIWHGEVTNRRKDGRLYTEEMGIAPVRDEAGRIVHFVAIKQDITQRKEALAELERQREALYRSDKILSMGQLLAGIAHELNNPLSVVLGRGSMLRRSLAGGPNESSVQKLCEAAERCGRIVKNFLALARKRDPERQRVDVNQVIREAIELVAYPLRVDNVVVHLDLAADLPMIWGDPDQLHQVLMNLVTNAHQAMRPVPPPHRLTIATKADAARSLASVRITDTGPGIPPEFHERIFEPFFTTKPVGQGTGLGLPLCRAIIEGHGGSIAVDSRPGYGSSFIVELPVHAFQAGDEAQLGTTPDPFREKTILVVDDEPEVAHVLSDLLSIDGHRVDLASDGVEGLRRLTERTYDVILSDLRMPNLDGPGFYRELERQHPQASASVAFVTGDTLGHEITEFLATTRRPTISKPFDLAQVRQVVIEVLKGRSSS